MKKATQKIEELNSKYMPVNFLLFGLALIIPLAGWGAPPPPPSSNRPVQSFPNRSNQGDDTQSLIRQLRTQISDLKNEVKNHEVEIRMFEERLHNQENSNEQMRQQLSDDFISQKDFSKVVQANVQTKIDNLETRLSGMESQIANLTQSSTGTMNDLRLLKAQANDSIAVLNQYKQKLEEMEGLIQSQNQHIANLETALQSIMEIFQAKHSMPASQPKVSEGVKMYKVQPGDNLEKIARSNQISVQQLRDYNQLTTDRIMVGQTLKIPQ